MGGLSSFYFLTLFSRTFRVFFPFSVLNFVVLQSHNTNNVVPNICFYFFLYPVWFYTEVDHLQNSICHTRSISDLTLALVLMSSSTLYVIDIL